MAYRKINYTPETLERRKEYQRQYARARRRTPEGLAYTVAAWTKLNSKVPIEEKRSRGVESTFRHRAKKLGICSEAVTKLIADGCQICGKTRLKNNGRRVLVLDHDHKTGKFRGILCSGCNTAIGQFKDDPKLVERALRYLLGET